MRRRMRWSLGAAALLLLALAAFAATPLGDRLRAMPPVGAGYAAEILCADLFVTGRDLADAVRDDLIPVNSLFRHARISADRQQHSVTVSLFGLAERSALFRPGLGCTLIGAGGVKSLLDQARDIGPPQTQPRPGPWPKGDVVQAEETPALRTALDQAMRDGDGVVNRALIVVHHGRIVGERYGAGFGPESRLLGWSMSKSVTAALIGIAVGQGALALDQPAPVAAWQKPGDFRHPITPRHLLTMTSGLKFSETYDPGDDATAMLYRRDDMAGYAAMQPLLEPPGQVWSYSSGSANILGRILADWAGGSLADFTRLARDRLFLPAGMTSAMLAPDASGTPVGSSYLYMTARDWARFGQLFLGDGELAGRRILPSAWVAETRRPVVTTKGERVAYGLQFWLNSDGAPEPHLRLPHCPPDLYWADGHNGQMVAIIPSQDAVIVRLGWDTGPAHFGRDRHVAAILAALAAD